MVLNAGDINQRVIVQAATESRGATGEVTKTWTTALTVWASIRPLSGRELLQAQQVQADVTHRVRMRHNTTVTTSHRLLFGTRILEINSVIDPFEAGEELELMCKETV